MTPIDVDSYWDLAGLLIVGLVVVTSAVVPAWIAARRTQSLHSDVTAMKKQVVNGHGDTPDQNMRVQMDRIEAKQELMAQQVGEVRDWQVEHGRDLRGLRQDVGVLRGEDRTAQAAHDDLVRRINAFIRREHPGADPL